jgi:putative tryptophan/tyrosine transport system substrate-binding protein
VSGEGEGESMTGVWRRGAATALILLAGVTGAGAADVAVLKSSDVAAWRPALDALRRAASGHTITEYDFRGDRAAAEQVVGSLKGKPVVLVAMGNLAAEAARAILPDAPLVFCMVQDPARIGLVPAPNLTGVAFNIPVKNQIAAFRMVNPRGTRIGVIFHPDNSGRQVEEATKAAGLLRIALFPRPVPSVNEIPQALRSLLSGDTVDALWIPADPMLLTDATRRFILGESLKAGKPVYSFSASLVSEGALVSNGPDLASIGEQAGELVNRLAAGEKSRIDMQVPRAELVINNRIAGKLKIVVPPDVLKAAGKVI